MGHAEAIIAEFLRRNPTDPHTLVCENHGYTGECPQGFEEDHRYCDACLTRLYRNALVAPYTYPCKHCGLPLDPEATLCSCRHCWLQIHRACRDVPCGDDGGAVAIDPRMEIIGTIEKAETRLASAGTPGAFAAISADIELARYELAALAAEVGTDGTPAEDNARYAHGGTFGIDESWTDFGQPFNATDARFLTGTFVFAKNGNDAAEKIHAVLENEWPSAARIFSASGRRVKRAIILDDDALAADFLSRHQDSSNTQRS